MIDMFKGSMLRGVDRSQVPAGLSLRGIFGILHLEISPTSGTIFLLTLILALAGIIACLRSHRRSLLLIGVSAVFPWLVFLLGNPRENDIASLYRYLQHLLPLIFMLTGQGVLLLASGAAALFRRSPARRRAVQTVAAAILAVLLGAGGLSNLRGFQFTDFWRQGSYRFDPQVRKALLERVDRDALLYIDAYPVASQLVMMNPLSKDRNFWNNELAAREEFVRSLPSTPVMIMAIDWVYFRDFVASRKIELWAVTPAGREKAGSLRAASADGARFEVIELPRFTLLHFRKDARSLADKMADLSDLLVSWLDGDAVLRRQRLIFAAQSYLLTRTTAETGGAIRAFRGISVSDREDAENAGTAAERVLGGLLGYGPKALREFFEGRSFAEIDNLLLAYGRNMIDSGNLPEARASLELFVNGEGADRGRAIEPLIALGDLFEKSGQAAQAVQVWEMASRLGPGREDIASRIAKIRGKIPD